ncbi:MAG: TadE/TadG family type IV pilus assembly protein [Candidatus Binataceae bacterium]
MEPKKIADPARDGRAASALHRSTARRFSRLARRGQTSILLAILLPSLVGAIALGVDISVFYFNWAKLQRAADAAALAGAAHLPSDTAAATSAATSYATLNSIAGSEIALNQIAGDHLSMTVQFSRTVPYYFAKVLGLSSGIVVARATATVKTAGAARHVIPIGVQHNTVYTYGQQLTLNTGVAPGNWHPLALGGNGASVYGNNIVNGYQGVIHVGDMLPTETGVMTGPTKSSFDTRIAAGLSQFPSDTFSNHSLNNPRVVVAPMVDFAGINGSSQVPVKGFAVLWLSSVASSGKAITAYFIKQTVPGSEPGSGGTNYGAYRAALTS